MVLYGSAARSGHASSRKFSDLNVLCVLKEITPQELGEGEPVLRWWREHGHPSPLLMSEEEAHNSADSFPIEFRDMKDQRKVLYGVDVIADLKVDAKYHRAQVEHELRAKLFRLRQQGAQVLSDPAGAAEVVRGFGVDLLCAGPACAAGGGDRGRRRSGARGAAAGGDAADGRRAVRDAAGYPRRQIRAGRRRSGRFVRAISGIAFAGWSNLWTGLEEQIMKIALIVLGVMVADLH